MALRTKVCNCSNMPLQLKEGTGGVYRDLTILNVGKEYTINCNQAATYREYWVGVRPTQSQPASTQSQPASTVSQAPDKVIITSDDCVAYKLISIQNSRDDPARLEVNFKSSRKKNSTMLVNHTDSEVTVTTRVHSSSKEKEQVLKPDQKVPIQVGTKDGCKHSVRLVGGETFSIDNKVAAKTQAVNIIKSPQAAADLDMVPKEWLQTEVTNNTGAEVTVTGTQLAQPLRLGANKKYIIKHDPKSEGSEYLVECPGVEIRIGLDDISKFERIDVERKPSGEIGPTMRAPRPNINNTKDGVLSKVGSKVKGLVKGLINW